MNLQEAISVLTEHQEWRMGAEISMMVSKKTTEAIRIILDDHLHKQLLETKPGFVEKREKQAWNIIEEKVANYTEEINKFDGSELPCSPFEVMQYLKTICHPPMLKS
jgi:hypothetical protein